MGSSRYGADHEHIALDNADSRDAPTLLGFRRITGSLAGQPGFSHAVQEALHQLGRLIGNARSDPTERQLRPNYEPRPPARRPPYRLLIAADPTRSSHALPGRRCYKDLRSIGVRST